MPASRAARITARPCSRGIRSNVRHEPSENSETSKPEEPRRAMGKGGHGRLRRAQVV